MVETKGRFFLRKLEKKEIEKQADEIEFYIRKAAHMTEYAVLTLPGCFWILCQWIPQKTLADGGFIFCVLYAATDEFHQSFVGGRGPSVRDVGIDSLGVLIASDTFGCRTETGEAAEREETYMREMRLAKREITDPEVLKEIVEECDTVRLGLTDVKGCSLFR